MMLLAAQALVALFWGGRVHLWWLVSQDQVDLEEKAV
jgi:hypothetical protein